MSEMMSAGEAAVAAVLGAIAWLVARATSRHLESMDSLASRIEELTKELAGQRAEMARQAERQVAQDQRLTRIERDLRP